LTVVFWSIRFYYGKKAGGFGGKSRRERFETLSSEGRGSAVLFVILFYFSWIWGALYILDVPFILWSYFFLEEWTRLLGIVFGLVSILYLLWVLRTLGEMWSYALEIQEEHKLITSGPYARIRHPMYTAHVVFDTGMVLVSLNWVFLVLLVIGIPYVYNRMFTEEKMMVEQFGEEYERYMKRTGRLFPKLKR
jgi:protein-S-isoprenylcysteine O-methyltransferase Ste14